MSVYHEMHCFGPLFTDVIALGAIPEFEHVQSWMSGQPLSAPVPEPITIDIDPDEPGSPLEMYELEALIVSDRLLRALRSSGVDNLQSFRVTLRGPQSGRVIEDYHIVNIVGAVSCADLSESRFDPPPGRPTISVAFSRLVIDESRTAGALLFRLAESLSTIIVHDDVKRHLETTGFDMLTFRNVTPVSGAS
jgi:hypothetical protein